MGRRILIASGKGGVGKTTISAGLGEALAKLGASVCVIDLDFSFNNLDVVSGLEHKVVYNLGDYLENRCHLKQTLVEFKRGLNLFFVFSSSVCDGQDNAPKLEEAIKKLSDVFDYVILDSPAGLSGGFFIGAKVATEVVLVVCPLLSSIKDAGALKNAMLLSKNITTKMIVNKIRGDMVVLDKMLGVSQIENILNLECVGVVPESDQFIIFGNTQSVLNSCPEINKAIMIIAENIHLNKRIRLDYCAKYKGIFGKLRAKLKKGA